MARLDPERIKTVAAILLGRLGDLIMATPFLRSLRLRFPRAGIRLFTSGACREAAGLIPFVDEALAFQGMASIQTAAALLANRCDLLVDLNPSFSRRSAALSVLARSSLKLSFLRGRFDWVFDLHADPPGEKEHMLERYARLAKALGAPYEPKTELRLKPEDEEKAEDLMERLDPKPKGLRVAIHPGNFKKFDNRWPEGKFAELTDRLLEDPGLSLFYLAGPGEEEPVRAIVARLKRPVPVLPPASLGVIGALMKRMDLCVLNITGTTHLAAALGVPTFGFYSGYTHAVWRPRGAIHAGVVSDSWESCRGIPVEEAWAALKALSRAPKSH